jgi:GH35 family endo-1,4-beta-xylanase
MASPQIPHLRQTANSKQLIVKDGPFLMLAGELQNSSFSSPEYMNDVWSKLTTMNMNTVLGSVSWEQIEPTEGDFDFRSLDQVLLDARAHDLHVVLLWFGSFKNGEFAILKVTKLLGVTKVQVSLLTRHIGSKRTLSDFRE